MRPPSASHRAQQGYAFITIIFMAAAMAVTLALALPRFAMQAQRVREERLIYRGKQYKRAIQLYFRQHKKYPARMKDLEDTNGVRYLRRRYKDPMNPAEDEWRIIHMGPDGTFKDSIIHDLVEEEDEQNSGNAGGMQPSTSIGASPPRQRQPGYQTPYPGFVPNDGRFRGGDRARNIRESAAPEISGQGSLNTGLPGEGQPPDPNAPPAVDQYGNPIPPEQQAQAGEQNQNQYPGYSRTLPSQIPPNNQPGRNQRQQAGRNQRGGNQRGYGFLGTPTGPGSAPSAPQAPRNAPAGFGNPGAFAGQGGGQAANIIKGLLTTPRPGGLAGIRNQQNRGQQASGFKGGIAGVASKAEEQGVKTYEGKEYFNEWEFVYDYRTDEAFGGAALGPQIAAAGAGVGTQQLPAGQPGTTPTGGFGAPPSAVGFGAAPAAVGSAPRGRAGRFPPNPAQPGQRPGTRSTPNPYENIRSGRRGINTNPQQPYPQQPYPQPPGTPGFPSVPGQPYPGRPGMILGPNGQPIPAPPGSPSNQPTPNTNQNPNRGFPIQPRR